MLQYLNAIGTYWDLLELNQIIQVYQKMMIRNIDEKGIYKNLDKNMKIHEQKQKEILGYHKINDIKSKILSNQDLFLNYLLENRDFIKTLYHSKIGNRKLPLYAIVQEIVKCDILFFDMYHILIQNNLYNPNLPYGTSDEPFYSLLPITPINLFSRLNQMVINNPKTDFHLLKNGSDTIENALYYLSNSKNKEYENYWKNYIMNAIMGSCSLLDSRRYHGILNYEMKPNIFRIMTNSNLRKIQEYLLSEDGINKQLKNSLYPSLERDRAINFYAEKISNHNIREKLYQKKYQK